MQNVCLLKGKCLVRNANAKLLLISFLYTYYLALETRSISQDPSSIYSWLIKPLSFLHSRLKFECNLLKIMQSISRKTIFFHLNFDQLFRADTTICLKMSKKGAQKYWHFFIFPYCQELPKQPKQNNRCSKMWQIINCMKN